MPQPAPARPPGRYGQPSPRRRLGLTAAVVVVATALVAWLGWAGLSVANPDVRSDVLGFDIRSDAAVHIRIEIIAASDRTVTCVVRGQDRTRETVGIASIVSRPGRRVRRVETEIATRARAVTATIAGCRTAGGR